MSLAIQLSGEIKKALLRPRPSGYPVIEGKNGVCIPPKGFNHWMPPDLTDALSKSSSFKAYAEQVVDESGTRLSLEVVSTYTGNKHDTRVFLMERTSYEVLKIVKDMRLATPEELGIDFSKD